MIRGHERCQTVYNTLWVMIKPVCTTTLDSKLLSIVEDVTTVHECFASLYICFLPKCEATSLTHLDLLLKMQKTAQWH